MCVREPEDVPCRRSNTMGCIDLYYWRGKSSNGAYDGDDYDDHMLMMMVMVDDSDR